MVHRDHLVYPFFVASRESDDAWDDARWEHFRTDDEASHRFMLMKDQKLAYLGEVGCFASRRNELQIDYVVFDTNDIEWWRKRSEIARMTGPGYGISWFDEVVGPYGRLSQTRWRL